MRGIGISFHSHCLGRSLSPFRFSLAPFSSRVIDPYRVLGVSRNATDDEIKKAFRKKAREYHPDVNKSPNATQMFQQINEAYEMIGDKRSRQSYEYEDQFQRNSQQFYQKNSRQRNSRSQRGPQGAHFTEEEIFEQFFKQSGFGKSQQQHHRFYRSSHGEPFFEFGFDRGEKVHHQYTHANLNTHFPKLFFLKEKLLHPDPNAIIYTIMREGNMGIGSIIHNIANNTYQWQNANGEVFAHATGAEVDSPWLQKEIIKVYDASNKSLGSIEVLYLALFPIYSRITLLTPKKETIGTCQRLAFMGTRLNWISGDNGPVKPNTLIARAFRGVVDLLGRSFDMEIGTNHQAINPALYMFAVLHSHKLDVRISPFRALGRLLAPKFTMRSK